MSILPTDIIETLKNWHRVLLLANSVTQTVRSFEKDKIRPESLELLESLEFELRGALFPNVRQPNDIRDERELERTIRGLQDRAELNEQDSVTFVGAVLNPPGTPT